MARASRCSTFASFILPLLIAAAPSNVSAAAKRTPKLAMATQSAPLISSNQPEFAATEDGCLDGRIEDSIQRHSDRGITDPAVMLELSREMQALLEPERHRKNTLSIGGNVWNSIGPSNGAGRATAIAIDPTLPDTMIVGAAGGGAWKTTDGGATWTPLTETIPNLSVGALAFARSSPSNVYLGTGEGGYASDFIPGIGLLASSDGGNTWTLPTTVIATQFYKIAVSPTSPQELVVGTNAGGFRSVGGQDGPWQTVIPKSSYGDVTDVVRDPSNPLVLYAATWDRGNWCAAHTCGSASNFAGSTVLKSTDGGQTWAPANGGLPSSTATQLVSRIALAIAPSSPATLYAAMSLTDTASNGRSHIFKTVDGGASWTETSLSSSSESAVNYYQKGGSDQTWYDNTIVVSPTDPNTVIAGGVYYVRTTDGGTTWSRALKTGVHADAHELTYNSAGALFVANDGGIFKSIDNGVTATDRNAGLVTRQYYTLSNDTTTRTRAFGGTQDNGTSRRSDGGGGTNWDLIAGGDGFGCAVIPTAPSILVLSYQRVELNRTNGSAESSVNLVDATPLLSSGEKKPFATLVVNDPATPSVVYTATNRVWKSADAGESWLPLPTATSDGSTWDLTSGHEVRSIAIAKSNSSVLMVTKGYDDASHTFRAAIFRSTDGGNTWSMTNSGLPVRYPTSIEIDPKNPNVAYVTFAGVSGTPVYKTIDGGASWSVAATGLPSFSAQVIRVDPTDSNTLYCGTDVGVYRSTDQGSSWSRFGSGMPAVSIYDIRASSDGSILRAASHGRGVWELSVTGATNQPPTASISSPGSAFVATRGVPVPFAGSVSDPDAGDSATASWTFPDTWETAAGSTASHTFNRGGMFPVTLLATDRHGATAAATVQVTVIDKGDDCNDAIIIPGGGPFPWSASVDTQALTKQVGDPGVGAPTASCYPYTPYTTAWFSFTPQATGTYDFYGCGSRVPVVIEVWSGAACGPYTLVPSACAVNFDPQADCGTGSKVSVPLTAGTNYRVMVTGYYYRGPATLTVMQGAISTQVASISPAAGSTAGGTPVIISGSNFTAPATVTIGGAPATSVNVISKSLMTATSAAHPPALADVVVSSGGATATLAGAFVYSGAALTTCTPSPSQLCFVANRYAVTLTATDTARTGKSAVGEANSETADTGYFTLSALTGSTQNPEVVAKVLEIAPGQPWVFFGGLTDLEYFLHVIDTQTGQVREYHKIAGSVQNGFDTGGGQTPAPETSAGSVCALTPTTTTKSFAAPSTCIPSSTALCLVGNRFKVEVTAKDAGRTNNTGPGQTRPKNDLFGFFSVPALTGNANNQEIFVKVLDGRSFSGRFWIFYGTLSDFEFTVTVTDTQTGQVKTYVRPAQTACGAADTAAFPF